MLQYVNFSGTDIGDSGTDIGDSGTDIHFGGGTVAQILAQIFWRICATQKADG